MRIDGLLRTKGTFVATIRPDATVADLVEALAEHGVGALVVSPDGLAIAGIVSERDVVRALPGSGAELLGRRVDEIMTVEVHTCTPDAPVEALAVLMTEQRVRHVPVVEHGRLAGIVSIGDVVKHRLGELEHENQALTDYIRTGR